MRVLFLLSCLSFAGSTLASAAPAQTAQVPGASRVEPFALPSHPGAMMLDLTGLRIKQASAKAGGTEIGIRAHDPAHTELLAFLFLTPGNANETAVSCMQGDLAQLKKDMPRLTSVADPDGTDTPVASHLLVTLPDGARHYYRYSGTGDQCFSVQVYADKGSQMDAGAARALLAGQGYDPRYMPTATDKYTYANILYRNGQYKDAIPIYRDFLAVAPRGKDALVPRRVATDNMGMAMGLAGDVAGARRTFTDAIHGDSKYPLYYYNLACADAEQGDAKAAREHLQQAFERRQNTNPGEAMPDPTQDASLVKLKSDSAFWSYAQSLSRGGGSNR